VADADEVWSVTLVPLSLISLSSAFGLDVGQSLAFQSRVDCEITAEKWDLNSAPHASRASSGNKVVTFLFPENPPENSQTIPIVEIDTTRSGQTYLSEALASAIPKQSDKFQPPILITVGEVFTAWLNPRPSFKNDAWDYEATQVGLHGDTIKTTGACTVISEDAG
jgi:hypothetical protein